MTKLQQQIGTYNTLKRESFDTYANMTQSYARAVTAICRNESLSTQEVLDTFGIEGAAYLHYLKALRKAILDVKPDAVLDADCLSDIEVSDDGTLSMPKPKAKAIPNAKLQREVTA